MEAGQSEKNDQSGNKISTTRHWWAVGFKIRAPSAFGFFPLSRWWALGRRAISMRRVSAQPPAVTPHRRTRRAR